MKKTTIVAIIILIATTGMAQSLKGFTVGKKVNENAEGITTIGGVPGMILPQTNLNDIIYSLTFIPIDEEQSKENTITTNNKLPSHVVEQFIVDVQHHYQIEFNEVTVERIKHYWALKGNIYYLIAVPEEGEGATASFIFSISDVSVTRANSSDF